MITCLISGGGQTTSTGAGTFTFYGSLLHQRQNYTNFETVAQNIIPINCKIGVLRVKLNKAGGLGATETLTVNLRKNGAPTSCTVTFASLTADGTLSSDTSHIVSFTAGDTADFECVSVNPGATAPLFSASILVSATGGLILMRNAYGFNALSSSITTFLMPMGIIGGNAGSGEAADMVVPTSGTLSNFFSQINDAPAAGQTRTLTVFLNGVATAMAITFNSGVTSRSYTATSISVVQGDLIRIVATKTGSPISTSLSTGILFTPTVGSEFPYMKVSFSPANTNTVYMSGDVFDDASDPLLALSESIDFSKMTLYTETAPGLSKARTYTLRKNGANTALTASIVDTNQSATDNSDTVSFASGNLVNYRFTRTGVPAASNSDKISCVSVYTGSKGFFGNGNGMMNFFVSSGGNTLGLCN